MKHYYYGSSPVTPRGFLTIKVYEINEKKDLQCIGYSDENKASWRGAKAVASHIIAEERNHKITDGYKLDSKNIVLHELPDR